MESTLYQITWVVFTTFFVSSVSILTPTTPESPIVEVPAPTNLQIIQRVKEITLEFSETFNSMPTSTSKPQVEIRKLKSKLEAKYYSYSEMTDFLQEVNVKYPQITHLYSIGKSIEGRDLWVLALGLNPKTHTVGRHEIKYIGNIQGNEPLTREILLRFILYIVTNYQSNSGIRSLLRKMRLHVMPSMNPDGAEKFHRSNSTLCRGTVTGRKNSAEVDLNRSFPGTFKRLITTGPAPERDAVQEWMKQIPFLLSVSFRSGAVVVTYPYDSATQVERKRSAVSASGSFESLAPDDDVFRHLAHTYSSNHAIMFLGRPCNLDGKPEKSFKHGIVNGAAWQIMEGGMQDYNYANHGTLEMTTYISCCKYVDPGGIEKVWMDNKNALQLYLAEANRGVRGFILAEDGSPVPNATIFIVGRENALFSSTEEGEYWRVLLNGTYILEVRAEGFDLAFVPFTVTEENPSFLNITMQKAIVSTQNDEGDVRNGDGDLSTISGDGVGESTEYGDGVFSPPTRVIPKDYFVITYGRNYETSVRNMGAKRNSTTFLIAVVVLNFLIALGDLT